jgi:hypothetical protein
MRLASYCPYITDAASKVRVAFIVSGHHERSPPNSPAFLAFGNVTNAGSNTARLEHCRTELRRLTLAGTLGTMLP